MIIDNIQAESEVKMTQTIEDRLKEICAQGNLSREQIWDMYVDKRIDYRQEHGSHGSIVKAVEAVGEDLKISKDESLRLYNFLHDTMLG